LGTKFDLRTFHDAMLDGGTLPLDLLDAAPTNDRPTEIKMIL